MGIVAALFAEPGDITDALDALEAEGFRDFTVFGPEELFTEPVRPDEMEEGWESGQHTAAGTISGISVNPRPYVPDDASADSIHDDLRDIGLGEADADRYVSGLHQSYTLLLVQSSADREEIARRLLREAGGLMDQTE
jgi:hypothetical protein